MVGDGRKGTWDMIELGFPWERVFWESLFLVGRKSNRMICLDMSRACCQKGIVYFSLIGASTLHHFAGRESFASYTYFKI